MIFVKSPNLEKCCDLYFNDCIIIYFFNVEKRMLLYSTTVN